jgi:hypothetical protein
MMRILLNTKCNREIEVSRPLVSIYQICTQLKSVYDCICRKLHFQPPLYLRLWRQTSRNCIYCKRFSTTEDQSPDLIQAFHWTYSYHIVLNCLISLIVCTSRVDIDYNPKTLTYFQREDYWNSADKTQNFYRIRRFWKSKEVRSHRQDNEVLYKF